MTTDQPGAAERPHLRPTVTGRGFTHLPPLVDDVPDPAQRTVVRAYESSGADGPHVWLSLEGPRMLMPGVGRPEGRGPGRKEYDSTSDVRVSAHLTTDDAWHLAEQLITLALGHHQGGTPPADRAYDVALRRAGAGWGGVVGWSSPDPTTRETEVAAWLRGQLGEDASGDVDDVLAASSLGADAARANQVRTPREAYARLESHLRRSCATCWPRACGEPGAERSRCRRRAKTESEVTGE